MTDHEPGEITEGATSEPDLIAGRRTVTEVLRDIQTGGLRGSSLGPDDRLQCVIHLMQEGLSVADTATVLGVSTRTISRDRARVHELQAIRPDERAGPILGGRLLAEYEAAAARIRRVTRDPQTPAAVRVEGERACIELMDRVIQRLQSLGLAPTAATRVQAEVAQISVEVSSLSDLHADVTRLAAIQAVEDAARGVAALDEAPVSERTA